MNEPRWPRVLLIDDNEGDIELTRDAFEEANINGELQVARDGREAVELLFSICLSNQDLCPDVMLLDLNMPDMDGREFLERIKEIPCFDNIPVVILTGSLSDRDVLSKYNLGACDYLVKPVGVKDIKSLVGRVLERRHGRY